MEPLLDDIDDEPAAAALSSLDDLDRGSALPLHAQIRRRLMRLIADWPSADLKFPTDDALSRHFGVSRMTVRKAIDDLVVRGYLWRRRGLGTFVAFTKVEEAFTPQMDFLDQWARHGRTIAIRLLEFGMRAPPADEAEALRLDPADTPCLVIRRLRSAGLVPVSLDLRVIAPGLEAAITPAIAEGGSLLDALRTLVAPASATMRIEATSAEGEVAQLLDVPSGDPVLFRQLLYRDDGGRLVMAGHSFYRADQARYVIDLPIAPAVPSPTENDR